jgi:hypothetical protein
MAIGIESCYAIALRVIAADHGHIKMLNADFICHSLSIKLSFFYVLQGEKVASVNVIERVEKVLKYIID